MTMHHRQIDRQLDRQIDRQIDKKKDRQRVGNQMKERERYIDRSIDRQIHRRQIGRQEDSQRKKEKERRPQAPFGPSVGSLCHPRFTTTNLSYRFPIYETSATALCGTTGINISRTKNMCIYIIYIYYTLGGVGWPRGGRSSWVKTYDFSNV